ncbi:hypothetical protein A7U60_g5225 [Sanghuangporus baumii]|uniref:Uncharacterized protein n=1 Tax=Sanghuangporus baumii TaxID=108892 RepID=A0A9Q5HXB4_SANBA|nr:hypothetical protein A7U60_g5225 [Sanghuangporus baumii]
MFEIHESPLRTLTILFRLTTMEKRFASSLTTSTRATMLPSLPGTYDEAWTITRAADKYDIPSARQSIQAAMDEKTCLRPDTLRLYALACHWKCADVTRHAAAQAAKRNIMAELVEKRRLQRSYLTRTLSINLIHFRRKQIDAFVSASDPRAWWKIQIVEPGVWNCRCSKTSLMLEDIHISISSVANMIWGLLEEERDMENILSDNHFAWKGVTFALLDYKCRKRDDTVVEAAQFQAMMKYVFQGLDTEIPWDMAYVLRDVCRTWT